MSKTYFEEVPSMFVCSVKMSTLKFVGAIVLCLVVLLSIFMMADSNEAATVETVSYEGIKTEEARRHFLEELGFQLADESAREGTLTLPKTLDRVLVGYNEIQKSQGFDLSKYCGKTITRYTYTVTNYPDYEGTVYANLLIYRGRVIGGDVCSHESGGFVKGLSYPK